MADTTGLAIVHLEQSQSQKEVTINDAVDALDRFAGILELTPGVGNNTLTTEQAQYGVIAVRSAIAGETVLLFPTTMRHRCLIVNLGTGVENYGLSAKLAGGSVSLPIPRMSAVPVTKNAAGTELEYGWQGPVSFWTRGYKALDVTLADDTWTKLATPDVEENPQGCLATTGIFTAPANGVYRIEAQARLSGLTSPTKVGIRLVRPGGVTYKYGDAIEWSAGNTCQIISLGLDVLEKMDLGQTASVEVYQLSGTTATIEGGPENNWVHVSVYRVGNS